MSENLAWTCGSDKRLECRRYIAEGGSGAVYEVSAIVHGLNSLHNR